MSATAPAPTNGKHRKLDGVRTYRGRKLEDLIPKIRAELGPEAIILREREGLMGGINGFFAQRFVEVEARAGVEVEARAGMEVEARRAGMPRVDVYDDDDLFEDEDQAATPPVPAPAEAASPKARPAPPVATTPPPVPAAPAIDELQESAAADQGPSSAASFARQLEEAAAAAFDDFGIGEPEAPAPEPAAAPAAELPVEPATPDPAPARPRPGPLVSPGPPRGPDALRSRSRPELPSIAVEPFEPPTETPAPIVARSAGRKPRRGASGRLARALTPSKPASAPQQLEENPAAGVARELAAAGISDAWAYQLIGEAGAHTAPFARQGGLRSAARGALASSIVHARPLPATGAAVAFVGAGGAGKTRCAATLASAYKRASTLSVSAISLASADGGRELAELVRAQGVTVAAGKTGSAIASRVEKGRVGGLVVVDTPAVAPGDSAAVQALATELEPLALDAVYIVLPATLGAGTGRRLLSGLAPLRPTGLAISHVDETDQLGIAVELAFASRTPVNYIHEGLDIETALSATDPIGLAERLLS